MTLYQEPLGLGKHSSESVQLSPQLSPQLLLEGVLSGSRHRPQRDPRGALPDSPHLDPSPQPCSSPWMPPTSRTATTLLRLQPSSQMSHPRIHLSSDDWVGNTHSLPGQSPFPPKVCGLAPWSKQDDHSPSNTPKQESPQSSTTHSCSATYSVLENTTQKT